LIANGTEDKQDYEADNDFIDTVYYINHGMIKAQNENK